MEQAPEFGHAAGLFGRPRVPAGMIVRSRFDQQLAAHDDVTVVCGPVGSGKTTLLAMWASSAGPSVFWCEPDAGRLPIHEIGDFAHRRRGILVIDRAEDADQTEYSRLGILIDKCPELQVIVATRASEIGQWLSASTNATLAVITARDLAFTVEDLNDVEGLDAHEKHELLQKSHGLAVAVREKLEDAKSGSSAARERFRSRLTEDLAAHEGHYESALRLSLLPRVDERILQAWGLPQQLLHELDRAGLAGWDGGWFALTPYVRDVLVADAEKLLPAEQRHRLIDAAVRSSLVDRDPLAAIRAAFQVNDLGLATDVVFQNILELLESRDASYEVFTSIPASRLRAHPMLTVTLVLLSNMDPQTRPRALQVLVAESLFLRLQPGRGSHWERVVYQVFEAVSLRLTPFAAKAAPRVRRAFEELAELTNEDFERLGRFGPMLHVHLGISAFYFRDFALARQCFEMADVKHAQAGRLDRVDPLSLRGGLAALSGDLPTARRLLDEADRAQWPAGWRTSTPSHFFNLGRTILALEEGNISEADVYLEAAGPIDEILEHWQVFALIRARRDRLAGEAELGLLRLKQLRQKRDRAAGTPMGQSLVDSAEAELLLSTGRVDAARIIASRAAKHSGAGRLVLAWSELALGRLTTAAKVAHRVTADPLSTLRDLFEADLVLLCVALRSKLESEARQIAARVALRLAATGLQTPLRLIDGHDRDALTESLLQAGIDHATVALAGSARTSGQDASPPPVSLTPREQKVLEALHETLTLNEVAELLFVSRNTLKSQLSSIYRKLGVSSRQEAVTRAYVLGLLQ